MKERPILFSGPMVRALLEGRKTQTRRIIKQQPDGRHCRVDLEHGILKESSMVGGCWSVSRKQSCPYGNPGDRLWVRETWAPLDVSSTGAYYRADIENPKSGCWKPSIHMPRCASRITLEITGVRVERLQDISRDDAIAEGIERVGGEFSCSPWRNYRKGAHGEMNMHCSYHPRSYQTLWESINGPGSWDKNPWVWVIEFKMVTDNA